MNPFPKGTTWFRSLYYRQKYAALWWAILPDGALHIRSELIKPRCLISEISIEMQTRTRHLGIAQLEYTVADKTNMSGTARAKDTDGETRADTFRLCGIPLRESTHDPAQGWTRVEELLGSRADGAPYLTIDPSCTHTIRALTNAITDPKDVDLVIDSANDQPLHALRIGAMSRPAPRPLEPPKLKPNAVGHLLEACRNGADERPKSAIAWTALR